jgi:phosphatidylserine/phosphatidylglycerophosphate/cardiolipin synthase-like enzyme
LIFSTILFAFIILLFLFTFYSRYELDRIRFAFVFAIVGALSGGLFGLVLSLLLLRKHGVWYVALAGLVGFGIGGFGLGEGLRRYLLTIETANLESGNRLWLVLAFLFFGLVGGAALGFIFSYLSEKTFMPQKPKWWQWIVAGVIVLLLIGAIRPILEAAADALTPSDAELDAVFDSTTIGTHWSDSSDLSGIVTFSGTPREPVIAANEAGQMAQAWSQIEGGSSDIYWLPGVWNGEDSVWQTPVNVSNSNTEAISPQLVIDSSGVTHIVWEEAGTIQYSQCKGGGCTPPLVISETPTCAPTVTNHVAPTLAIDDANSLMAVWESDKGQLLYRAWPVSAQTPTDAVNCVPATETGTAGQPQLDGGSNGHFALVYLAGEDAAGVIHTISYLDAQWGKPSPSVGNGHWPNIFLDEQDEIHLAWCSNDNDVRYAGKEAPQTIPTLTCGSRPEMAQDSQKTVHVIWFGDAVVDVNGHTQPQTLLYESTRTVDGWTEPAIIDRTEITTQPSIAATENHLHLVWHNKLTGNSDIAYASFIPYSCDDYPLSNISQIAYDVARRPKYRPADDLIPYCQNQFHQLVFMSNPNPAFSDQLPKPNGGFDAFAELAQTARYEVLFTTMWYEADQTGDSPGSVLAGSVASLYEKLKANPEQYPRGLTVRILLGNPPQLNVEPFSDQPYSVLADLRDAGVEKMVDLDIGWKVEVADFDGAMPHSHTKFMIIDGKTILAAGFNMEYKHYAVDHPSGLGAGKQDLGLLVTGPVLQNSHRTFDDLWEGSGLRACSDFYPSYLVWQATCRRGTAVADHVPEVLKYYLPGADSTIFSMYRSKAHDEADHIVESSLAVAQNQVDAMHTMFAMGEMACDLNLLFELCDFKAAAGYLEGLMQAAENGAAIRLIISPQPLNGIENAVAYDVFLHELENRGLRDQVEIRFFEGPVHYKTTLIDNEFLVVGSQNFHYSAYGRGEGLSEYSLGTNDAQAIEDYQHLFEYQWEQSTPR